MTERTSPRVDLTGLTVLVTGGGRGIGRALAVGCAAHGARVVVAAPSEDQLFDTVHAIEETGGEALAVACDITRSDSVINMVAEATKRFGKVDALVNNAGIHTSGLIDGMAPEEFARTLEVNVMGTLLATQAVVPAMKRQGGGKIVNVASVFGLGPVVGQAAYGASKAAIVHMTKVAALELARHDIQVNAVAPGYIATDMSAGVFEDPDLEARVLRRIPARRIAAAEELVPLVALLLSAGSDYMTGNVIAFDGGFQL